MDVMYEVRYGVKGAHRISTKRFEGPNAYADAKAFADRWARSNSIGSYVAQIHTVMCECEVEEDGDGESGPHISIVETHEDCPYHGSDEMLHGLGEIDGSGQ